MLQCKMCQSCKSTGEQLYKSRKIKWQAGNFFSRLSFLEIKTLTIMLIIAILCVCACVRVSVTSTFKPYHWFKKKHGTHILWLAPTPNAAPCNFLQSATKTCWTGKPIMWEVCLKNADPQPCQHTAQIHTKNSYPIHGEP
jgi:hypothetical protein